MRQKLVRGITALVENKAMGNYSFVPEMNEAVGIALAVNNTVGKDGKRTYGTVQDYVKQQILPGMPDGLSVEKRASVQLAEALESGGQKDFALWYGGLNASLAEAAKGQSELFTGSVESKESILDRYVGFREDLDQRKAANQKTLTDPAAGTAAKARAALDDAGIARAEADGSLFQLGGNPVETLINRAGSMLDDLGERETVVKELRELERLYPPESNQYLAPNGKASLLIEALGEEHGQQAWYAVRTDSFKKWFGDWENDPENASKVVDENGEPKPIFHGTNAELFDIFKHKYTAHDTGFFGKGFYFATHQGEARFYGKNIYSVFLNIKKPFDFYKELYGPDNRIATTAYGATPAFWKNLIRLFPEYGDEKVSIAGDYITDDEGNIDYSERKQEEITWREMISRIDDLASQLKAYPYEDAGRGEKYTRYAAGDYGTKGWDRTSTFIRDEWLKPETEKWNAAANIIHDESLPDWSMPKIFLQDHAAEFSQKIMALGYDGINAEDEIIGFNSTQIKSATDNAGTYSGENPSILFQTYDELLEDAARYESAEDFEAAYRNTETRPDDAYISTEADRRWYEIFWRDARIAAGLTEETTPAAPEQADRAFLKDINRDKLQDILTTLDGKLHDRQKEPLAPEAGEDRAPYDKELAEYQKAQNLKARINRELPHMGAWVGIAAKVANGEELSSGDYNTLRGYLRQAPRDYRALFADLTGRREWGLNLTEMQDGVPNTRLSAPRLERSDDMDAKNRQRLADAIGDADPELSQGIREGTITMDDPRIAAFEKGLTAGIKKREEAAAATEAAADEDARKFKGTIQGQALNLYREFKEAEEKHQAQTTELAQKIRRGKELTSREREETTRLLTDSDAAHAAFEDFAAANNLRAEVREELARIDARYAERQRLRELQKKRNVVREVKRIKKGLITNIFRRVNYKNITYREGLTIRIIQRYVEPLLVRAGIRQWVGTGLDDRSLKEMYYEMKTNADFLDKLLKKVGYERAVQIEKLLETKWDFFTGQDKAALIRALPKHDWVEDLNIEGLKADEEENSIQIEIKKVDGKEVLGEEEQRIAREALGDELFTRIGNQALAEWTLVEMAELAEAVNDLYAEGRENFRIRQEVQYTAREKLRNDILATIKKAGIEINDDDSPEEKKRKLAKRAKLLNKFVSRDVKNKPYWDDFKTADTRRFTTEMDGGRKGAFTNQMYWAENDAYNQEESEKRRRYEAMIKILEANHINLEELFKKVEIPGLSVPGKDLDMTVDRLLYYRRGSKNDFTRQALLYGVLTSADERRELKRYRNVLAAQDSFADAAEARLKLILDYQEAFFNREENKKFLALEEAAGKDWDENGDRLNQFMISEYNRPMRREDNYVTMHRLGPNGEATDYDIIDDLTAGAGAGLSWVNKGFAEHRQHILPWNQTPIDTSFYGVWVKSVEASEHLMAYGHFVRNLHAVFKSGDSGAILENLRNHWGQPAIDWINGFIDEKARPDAGITRASGLMRIMRGKTATAYLAGRTSSILKQKVTSPWPYLQEGLRPDMYIAACLECAEGFGKVNDFIRGKSNYMRTRDADMMLKLIREAQAMTNTPWGRRIDKVNNFLMKGLTWADWSSVAPGWLVKYRTELTRLTAERDAEYQSNLAKYHEAKYAELYKTEEAITQKALEETRSIADVDYEAVAMADDMVRRLQPSSRNTDQASMFKQNNEFVNALLQFQNALGTIYKNFRYDIPQYVREGQVMKIVGMVTGYAMAGICVVALVDWPFDDDDEKEKDGYLARWAIFNSLTQLSDSVPFIGSEIVTPNLEWVIRGKRSYQGNSSIYPVAKKAFESTAGIATLLWEDDPEKRGEKFRKAATAFGEAVSIYNGIPVSGIEELGRAAGIGDGDGELEFYPQALLGQRKRKK
jgi:hypothetical protein